jgi:NADP-dependent 3-hydroxy acid dehydrogenase YdfG
MIVKNHVLCGMKTVVITGVTKGIGYAIGQKFHDAGFEIIGCARNVKDLDRLREEWENFIGFTCDVSQKDQVLRFAKEVERNCESVDLLVNNAGIFIPGYIHQETPETFEQQLHTNLFSAYYLTNALLPRMVEQQKGTIVNICSTASITAYTNGGSYCISKFALYGFSKVLRAELKDKNIRVISVLPGATLTDSWSGTDLPKERFMEAQSVAESVFMAYNLPENTVIEEIIMRPLAGDIGN